MPDFSMHLTIKGTLLVVLFFAVVPAAISDDTSRTASQLSSIPGAMGDPFAGLMLTSPSFTIPKLNRFPPIIEGMPQSSVGYLLNGCPVVFGHQSSGPAALNEQSIYPGSSGFGGVSVPMAQYSSGPFFFDGYRSWFHGTSALRFSQDFSYVPPEYGFFAGPMVAIASGTADSIPRMGTRADNREASLDASIPVGSAFTIGGGGRIGYNGSAVREWVRPYTSNGAFSYAPVYGDYTLTGAWKPSDRLEVKMHLVGAGERLDVRSSESADPISATSGNHTVNTGTTVNARLFGKLQSKSAFSLTTGNSSTSVGGSLYSGFGTNRSTTAVTFTEKLSMVADAPVVPYLGVDARKHFGASRNTFPTGSGTIGQDTVPETRFAIAPFTGLHATPLKSWEIDAGLRFESYRLRNRHHGALLAVSPRYSLADSVNGNLCYRFRTSFELPGGSRLSLTSGTSSQSPSLLELHDNPELSTIKTSRHSLTFAGKVFLGTGYRINGYFNELWDIPVYPALTDSYEHRLQSSGCLRARGATVQVDHTFAKLITAMLGYSISSNDSRTGDSTGWRRSDADRRHKFNALLQGHFPFGLEYGVNCMVTSGAPCTPLVAIIEPENYTGFQPIFGSYNTSTGDPYCNLSASVGYSRRFGRICIGAFVEGVNLLQHSPGYSVPMDLYYSTSEQLPFSIDTRSVVFGINVEY